MAKSKSYFFCRNCGYQSASWLGRCPECGQWNTFDEEVLQRTTPAVSRQGSVTISTPKLLHEVQSTEQQRVVTGCGEFDRVLGGGIVPGSIILLGGEPGIGKSTLLLQTALALRDRRVLYVSGEESEQQIKMRADRIAHQTTGMGSEGSFYLLTETVTQRVFEHAAAVKPDLMVVDSIQTMCSEQIESSAGSISQIRQCAAEWQHYAKESGIPVLLVGHITKDGTLAGPKVMEHIVDVVLQFEGDRNYGFRVLRALKNRFGSTAELGIFEMRGDGLREVVNPSAFLLNSRDASLSGSAVAATLEGARPLFVEVQSLVSSAVYGTPQRNANGFDMRRMNMLLAVLEKRCGFRLGAKDVFLNIAGGLRVSDPAMDLAVACSILSSNIDSPISPRVCMAAEMGLSGELRPVVRLQQRLAEADRLGFETAIVSKYSEYDRSHLALRVVEVGLIEETVRTLFS